MLVYFPGRVFQFGQGGRKRAGGSLRIADRLEPLVLGALQRRSRLREPDGVRLGHCLPRTPNLLGLRGLQGANLGLGLHDGREIGLCDRVATKQPSSNVVAQSLDALLGTFECRSGNAAACRCAEARQRGAA